MVVWKPLLWSGDKMPKRNNREFSCISYKTDEHIFLFPYTHARIYKILT